MNAMQLLTGPLAQSIGWALLHLLWQATIVAGILAAVLALVPRQSANARYVASCSALAIVFAMFIATAIRAYDPGAAPITPTPLPKHESTTVSLAQVPLLIAETAAASWRDRAMDAVATARQSLPSIVATWLLGVILLSSRLLVSWIRARRLVTHGAQPANAHWQLAAARISEALGLRRAVRLLESAAVEVPSVLGSLRPIILLPASTLTGMTPEQIEMVLAHELAHIRRHDFLVNLLQAFVETLMFYHPAVWWMSRRVRIERENCCDDLAVAVCGNPIQYARALTRLEELRAGALPVVVAANGGSLLDRIRRIAAGRAESTGVSSRWAAALVMLVILGVALAVPSLPALAQRDEPQKKEPQKKQETPQPASAKIDIVDEAAESDDDFDYEAPETPEPPDMPEVPDVDVEVPDVDVDVDVDIDTPDVSAIPVVAPVAVAMAHPTPAPSPAPMVAPAPPVPGARTPRPMAMLAPPAPRSHDDDEEKKGYGTSGKLTVDELIHLRSVGVTPEYVQKMRAIYPELTLRQIANLRAVGVTPDYVTEMKNAGLEVKSARELQSLAAVGVTGEWIRAMRAAGIAVKSAKDATGMAAVGVTPQFVKQVADMGWSNVSARELQSLAAVGVSAEYLRDMRAVGVKIETVRDATSLAAVGVSVAFVKQLAAAGYGDLSVRELTRLAAVGIDGDFIREMEQYRDKKK